MALEHFENLYTIVNNAIHKAVIPEDDFAKIVALPFRDFPTGERQLGGPSQALFYGSHPPVRRPRIIPGNVQRGVQILRLGLSGPANGTH